MAYTYTRTSTIFTAGEKAPSVRELFSAEAKPLIPNDFGNMALTGFAIDRRNPHSKIEVDMTVEPPVMHLTEALSNVVMGYSDESGSFILQERGSDYPVVPRATVSGDYSGPGSELELV